MMTVVVHDAKIQEVCDAALEFVRNNNVGWLRKVNQKYSVGWFNCMLQERCEELVECETAEDEDEVLAVVESLVLCKFANLLTW